MINSLQISKMSREEKVQAMEVLWADLSRDGAAYPSPDWHEDVLKETASRVAEGREKHSDWTTAKQDLRERFK